MSESEQRVHGGNLRQLSEESGLPVEEILDFSASINPLGPPPWFRQVINRHLSDVQHYPDPDSTELVSAIAAAHELDPACVVAANGTTEIIYHLPRALDVYHAVVVDPSYADYRRASELGSLEVHSVPLERSEHGGPVDPHARFQLDLDAVSRAVDRCGGPAIVWLGRPNNPTGEPARAADILAWANDHQKHFVAVDESFLPFVDDAQSLIDPDASGAAFWKNENAGIIVLRSFTKFYAVPGLRLGYAIGSPTTADRLRTALPTWSLNSLAAAFGVRAIADTDYAERTREYVRAARSDLVAALDAKLPENAVTVFPGTANYLLLRINEPFPPAPELRQALLSRGIAVRVCSDFVGLDDRFIRIAVLTTEENARLVEAVGEVLEQCAAVAPTTRKTPTARRRRHALSLMIQGTASNAGKSVLAAAMCRILFNDGYRVAPFKAQNMSLNSFVTADGGEMGRAQVVQAQACRLQPDVRMNPILLKPNTNTGSQVIVRGKPIANMEANRYFKAKQELFGTVTECYDSLADEFDVLILEGAGSPGEVNLKSHDIVNMRMAAYADAPVLLAGDIDRGGVFASFVGTMDVLEEWERRLVSGFLVNKFRGDPTLLSDALAYTFDYTGKRVLGVIPMIRDLGLPEEDSVSFKEFRESAACHRDHTDNPIVRVGVVDMPHISNFTDLDAFSVEPGVELVVIRKAGDIATTASTRGADVPLDAIVIPGSKSVAADLAVLRREGTADAIIKAFRGGMTIVGICGGFQMLGESIEDPEAVESGNRAVFGLGLLPIRTVMGKDKVLRRRSASHVPSGCLVEGYEIHHGLTMLDDAIPVFLSDDGEILGVASEPQPEAGPVWGTYLHGVFDADAFRRHFIDALRVSRGLAPLAGATATYEIESALDRLASTVRENVDMESVLRILEKGVV